MMDWTPENVAMLHKLIDSGMTASNIGRHFGCTRNSVIGKARREGRRFGVSFWQPERIAQLRKLVHEGMTSLEIAQAMGNSRSAILAKAASIGLKFRGQSGSRPKPPNPSRASSNFRHGRGCVSSPEPVPPRSLKITGPTEQSLNVFMWDDRYGAGCCKWPTITGADGSHRFCCAPADGDYCAPHGANVYQPSQKKPPGAPKSSERAPRQADDDEPKPLDFEAAA